MFSVRNLPPFSRFFKIVELAVVLVGIDAKQRRAYFSGPLSQYHAWFPGTQLIGERKVTNFEALVTAQFYNTSQIKWGIRHSIPIHPAGYVHNFDKGLGI